jgi:hypothetical protein
MAAPLCMRFLLGDVNLLIIFYLKSGLDSIYAGVTGVSFVFLCPAESMMTPQMGLGMRSALAGREPVVKYRVPRLWAVRGFPTHL